MKQLSARKALLEQIAGNPKVKDPEKKAASENLKSIPDSIKEKEFRIGQIVALGEAVQTLQKIATLQFRVYTEVVDGKKTYQVDLFKSEAKK